MSRAKRGAPLPSKANDCSALLSPGMAKKSPERNQRRDLRRGYLQRMRRRPDQFPA
jgi:hypothetical protein